MHFHDYPNLWKQTSSVFGLGRYIKARKLLVTGIWLDASALPAAPLWQMCFAGQVVLSGLFSLWAFCPGAIFLKGNLAMSFLFHFRVLCKAVTLLFCFDGGYSMGHLVYITEANVSFKFCDPLNIQYNSYFLLPTLKSKLWGGSMSQLKCSGLHFKKVNMRFLSLKGHGTR